MMIVGITGSSGSGKSACSLIFQNEGFEIIDCDKIAHDVVRIPECQEELCKFFGEDIFHNNVYDRKKVAGIVFNNKAKLSKLNDITHKYIIKQIEEIITECKKNDTNVLIDAPLLYEAKLEKICDKTVSVVADKNIKIQRLVKRDNITSEMALKRLDNQLDDDYYIKKSDYVIYNNDNDEKNLYIKVMGILIKLKGDMDEEN